MPTNNTEHTPLPWKMWGKYDPILRHLIGPLHDYEEIATTFDDEANAEFIVRACNSYYELLEALRPFAKFACDVPHVNEPMCHNCRARAAIAKAEGRES